MSFYHPLDIGALGLTGNLFLAPVAGYSDRAFRSICYDCGADFAYTEMVSAEAIARGSEKTAGLMARAPNEAAYGVQIFGSDPHTMAQATQIVLERAKPELIDINAGCPVPKIIKTGAGSALTRDPERLNAVTAAVVAAAKAFADETGTQSVPVTVKIRSGWDASMLTWKEAAAAAAEAGAAAITLHARTRAQAYEGKSDWAILSQLSALYKGTLPIFGSGDVFSPEDARHMFQETGCDAVMFARGAMGNPFIFSQTRQLLTDGSCTPVSAHKRISTGLRELELLCADKDTGAACREMRKRLCAYVKGIPGAAEIRSLIVTAETPDDYRRILSDF